MRESFLKSKQRKEYDGDEILCCDGTYELYRRCTDCKAHVNRWWILMGKVVCNKCKERLDSPFTKTGKTRNAERRKYTFSGPYAFKGQYVCSTCNTFDLSGYEFGYGWQCDTCFARKIVPEGWKGADSAVREQRLYAWDEIRAQRAAARNSGNGYGRFVRED